jgi:glycosyltransferase involved in cell wall biosynthesis
MISVIIPTRDEAGALRATLDSVAKNKTNKEVISVDGTSELAGENGSRVLFSLRQQRAYQMNLVTQDAHGSILLFLHADRLVLPVSRETRVVQKNALLTEYFHAINLKYYNSPVQFATLGFGNAFRRLQL